MLRPPVDPLTPPPGTFDRIRSAARRRRWARAAMSASSALLIVAVGVPGTMYALQSTRDGRPVVPPALRSAVSSPTPSPPPSPGLRSPSPTVAPGGDATGRGGGVGPPGGPVPPGFVPESVTFVSRGLGWAIGQAPCSDPPCTSIVRTMDGGRSWGGIPAPRTGGGDQPDGASELRFADPRNGWAYGPGLWSTHDGGATWRQVGAPGGGRVLAVAAAGDRVVAAVSTCGKNPNCDDVRAYGGPAGADRWRPIPGARVTAGSGVSLAVRRGSAYLAGGPGEFVAGPMDGSARWTIRPLPCTDDDAAAAGLAATADGELVVVCASRPGAGGQPKTAYFSSDGGGSWDHGGRPPAGGLMRSVAVTGANIFVATNHGLLVSANGGRQWRRDLTGRSLGYVGFTTDSQGVAVPSGGEPGELLLTYDAGRTWSPVRFP